MHDAMNAVREFHRKVLQPIGDREKPDVSVDVELRLSLLEEELIELRDALHDPMTDEERVIAVADALADISYVVAGAGVTWGIDLGAVFDEVHRSNMTKSAGTKRADGKILKGPGYEPPDIKQVLARQIRSAGRRF